MASSLPLDSPQPRGLPVVAIVGRPNVGKSTLFNRLIGERKAIVDNLPGVTRDRNYGEAEWSGRRFVLIDTGGLDFGRPGNLEERIQAQSRMALTEADVVLFLLDGKEGLNPLDRGAVELLRQVSRPVLFAVNKIDSAQRAAGLYEFYALGLEHLFPISAEHGLGIAELLDEVIEHFPEALNRENEPQEEAGHPARIAIVGRPNVGKSTLVNYLLGFERSVVDSLPGTTRDAVDSPFTFNGEAVTLVDTAGVRRKARIDGRIERFSVQRTLRSVDRGDLIVYVLDGPEGVTDQDAQILSYAHQRGKAMLLAVNKWDLMAETSGDPRAYRELVYHKLPFLDFVPVAFIAAATGYGVRKMLETAGHVIRAYRCKVSTSVLNQALQQAVRRHAAPLANAKPVKFFYGTQTGTQPPTFTFFVNSPRAVSPSYQRYLVHQLRQDLALDYTPLKLVLRPRRENRRERRS